MPPVNKQDIPSDGVVGEFLGISAGGVLDWLPVSASGSGDMLKSENLSGLADYAIARTNIGLGLTSSPEFANLTLTSPSLSSSAPVTISQTWNAGSNVMTALKVVATDTASGSTSNLLELWAGNAATLKSYISKNGDFYGRTLLASGNIALTSSLSYYTGYLNGLYIDHNAFVANQGAFIGFSAVNNSASNGADVKLFRDGAANTLALRNGTSAQTFNVYGTYTSASAYERMFMRYNGTDLAFEIGTQQLGATARSLIFSPNGVKRMVLAATGSNDVDITAAANASRNIAIFRNLTGIAKYQFFVNAAGNAELYVGANTIISEVGNSYFNGGNVGIGTTSPTSKLHVAETWNAAGTTFTAVNVNVTDTASAASSKLLDLQVGGVSQFNVDKNGVAILSASGVPQLRMISVTGSGSVFNGLTLETSISTMAGFLVNRSTGEVKIGGLSNAGYFPTFYSNNAEAMRITTSGNVGIGTTSPTSKLQVSAGDVEVDTIAKGVILKSPDGTRYRVTVANGGTLSVAAA